MCALVGPGPFFVFAVGLDCGGGGGTSDPGGRGGGWDNHICTVDTLDNTWNMCTQRARCSQPNLLLPWTVAAGVARSIPEVVTVAVRAILEAGAVTAGAIPEVAARTDEEEEDQDRECESDGKGRNGVLDEEEPSWWSKWQRKEFPPWRCIDMVEGNRRYFSHFAVMKSQ
ncbi:hypothetical protein B0H19DRAFT_1231838 [Mycena capillaripes]|nr:hypothetical protein B0H19DRAFT_1231838 [Mycena capillaripes]